MVIRTISVSVEVEAALIALQEAVTLREAALNIAGVANDRLRAQRVAMEAREIERGFAENNLDGAHDAVERAQAELIRALGGRVPNPITGDLE
jgi:hypothetical protein